jgi:HEAT repeats
MKYWGYWGAAIVVTVLCAALECRATALPHLRISELVDQSDIVVVAQVSDLKEIGTVGIPFNGTILPGKRYSVEAVTLYRLGGLCPDSFSVQFQIPSSGVGYLSVRDGTRMLFLKKVGDTLVPTNPYYPDLPAIHSMPSEFQGRNVLGQVIAELGAVIASPDATPEEKVEILSRSYAIPEDDQSFQRDMILGVRNTADPDVRSRIQSILLSRNDISELHEVCNTLIRGEATAHQKEMLLYGIGYGLKDQSALPELIRLLESSDPEVRVATTRALWHTASKASIAVLMKALDDENPEVRYLAIRGLADATQQPRFGPSPAAYSGHEGEYQQYWKDWANQKSEVQQDP